MSGPSAVGATMTLAVPKTAREWVYYCDDCGDTGWRGFWCGAAKSPRYPDLHVRKCEADEHASDSGHEWMDACQCRPHNPAWLKRFKAERDEEPVRGHGR